MSRTILSAAAAALALALAAPAAFAQDEPATPAMKDVAGAALEWNDAEVPGFLPGMKIAGVHGDPSVADAPYTLRLAFPEDYKFPPHWHPRAENVTVLEGTFRLAMGEKFDESELKTYAAGDYLFIPGEHPHFGGADGGTVLQLHGVGPFDIVVVEGQGMAAP